MVLRTFAVVAVVFTIMTAGAFAAFQIANASEDAAARDLKTQTNESLTQTVGVYQLVDKATQGSTVSFNDTVTVYNNTSTQLTEGVDYEWNGTDGSIQFLSSANTTDGENATITYQYGELTDTAQDIGGVVGVIVALIEQLPIAVAGLGFSIIILAFGAFWWRRSQTGLVTNR